MGRYKVNYNFNNFSAFVEIENNDKINNKQEFNVQFFDYTNGELLFSKKINPGWWVNLNKQEQLKPISIKVSSDDGEILIEKNFDLNNQKIEVKFDIDQMQKIHNNLLILNRFKRKYNLDINIINEDFKNKEYFPHFKWNIENFEAGIYWNFNETDNIETILKRF